MHHSVEVVYTLTWLSNEKPIAVATVTIETNQYSITISLSNQIFLKGGIYICRFPAAENALMNGACLWASGNISVKCSHIMQTWKSTGYIVNWVFGRFKSVSLLLYVRLHTNHTLKNSGCPGKRANKHANMLACKMRKCRRVGCMTEDVNKTNR